MKKYLFFIVLCCQMAFSQSKKAEEVIENFNQTTKNWQIPLPKKQTTNGIVWEERKSSLSSEGIKTFVGYANGQLVGVVSIYQNSVSGSLSWQGKNYVISSKKGKISVLEEKEQDSCGTCEGGHCSAHGHSHEEEEHSHEPKTQALYINQNEFKETPEIYSDGILREYRLAILVDYSAYTSWFGSDIIRVKTFLSQVEIFMNEVYKRDIGVKFTMVNDEKLVRTQPDQEVFKYSDRMWRSGASYVTTHSTSRIDGLIGTENYDTGLTICLTEAGYNGLADFHLGHSQKRKASAWARNMVTTVAHELGHLFGSLHTFSVGGEQTIKTEPDIGNSLMSYGHNTPRDYFSLPSVNYIRQSMLINAPGYFADRQHTQKVGIHRKNGNAVYGIDTKNKPPHISRKHLKKEYRLPKQTFFQFDIKATDPDGDKLLYMAHQADIIENGASKANFISRKPSTNSVVPFITEYKFVGSSVADIPYTAPYADTRGEFTFWIGVSDAGILLEDPNADHATQYDMVQTKVKIEEGTPFKITDGIKSGLNINTPYNAGQKINLKWSVDRNFFDTNSKVKISLSDDFGKTFKYVLLAETENDGEAEITLPNIEIGDYTHSAQHKTAAGMLKIEVLDHIAVAVTENNPLFGGFKIKKSQISFEGLPEQYIKVKETQVPTMANVTATSTCGGNVNITSSENIKGNIIERTWVAKDACNNEVSFTQFIIKEKEVTPLKFTNAPEDTQLVCVGDLPEAQPLTMEGGDNPVQTFSQSKMKMNTSGKGLIIKRLWEASDDSGQSISHTQTIIIYDNVAPVLSAKPANKIVKSWAEVPTAIITLTATDNCEGEVEVRTYQGNTSNDAQGRERYYHSWYATDSSGNEVTHEQYFTLDPTHSTPTPLSWVETSFPENKTVNCASKIPSAQNPQTTGGQGTTSISVSEVIENKTCANGYTLKRIYTAKNGSETISHTQTIEVNDTTKPSFVENLPSDISIEEGNEIPSQANLTATDNCGTASVEKISERNGNQIIYKWVAKDLCGNETSHTQTITIKPRNIAPITWTNTLPQNIKVSCAGNIPNAENLTAIGGEGTLTISHNDVRSSEVCSNQFTITRTYTATDGTRRISHTQTIEVEDKTAPTFVQTLPSDLTINEGDSIPTPTNLTATDNCGTASVVYSERRENGTIIRHWKATDLCGNFTEHTQTITIRARNIAPITWTSTLPQNIKVSCGSQIPNAENLTATGGEGTLTISHNDVRSSEICSNQFTITRTYTATDGTRSIQHQQTIEVEDKTAPTFVEALPSDFNIEEGKALPSPINLTASDNCGTASVVYSERRENRTIIRHWKATDPCGNFTEHTQTITIKPKSIVITPPSNPTAPVVNNSAKIFIYNGVSTKENSDNYFKIADEWISQGISVEIFNEMGQRIYKNDHYGKNGEVFRGYANEKGVFRKEKPLPQGTYFYIIKFKNGNEKNKAGYLVVK